MIYRVVLDEMIDILTPDNPLINPSVELEMNSAGSFNFTLPPDHPAWNEVFVLKTTVDVYEDNELIFTGRVANIDKNWNNERVVECEGALAYFNDSVQRPTKWETPLPIAVDPDDQPEDPGQHIRNFLEDILNNHNAFVPENRQIHMGHIYIDHCDVTREVEYETTLDVLTRMCIDTNGGWFMIRKDPTDHKLYLDWLKDFTQESDQKAQFGVNLLDFGAGVHAEDVCTGVLAKGAEVNDNTLLLTDVELVDETTYPDMSVTHYTDHDQDILWHREGVAAFGEVVQVHDFSDAQTAWKDAHGEVVANSLFEVAKKWLEEKNTKVETFEVEVAELGWLDEGVPVFRLGQIVELNDAPHMTGEPVRKLPMYKLSCDLNSGSKKVTLGTPPKKELTQISASNSDANTLSTSGSSSGSGGSGGSGEECKVHDVRVDGTSVVTDKIANISLTGKADTSTVNALAATVATKADASTVTALADVVSGKQDQIEFNTQEAATEVLTRLKANNTVYNLGGGTEVVANPSETATDDLETIKIGDTVYDIPGGGSTNYGKFKCELIFNTATRSSGWSDTVTVCTKDVLDEYDAIYVTDGMMTNGAIRQETKFVLIKDIESIGDNGYQYMFGTDPNGTSFFVFGLRVYNNNLIWYSDRNGGYLFKVYGIKFENKLINRSDIYSEEEIMIGRWTDGKPLYQKTVEFNFTSNTNDWTVFDTSVSYDRFIQAIAATKGVTATEDQIMSYQDSLASPRWCIKNDHKLYYYLENAPRKGAVTIQYTKTTDTPDSGVIPEDPMFISDPMIFSEEEQVVGRWTDGKPLYQKTITISSVSADTSWHEVAHNISDIDTIGSVEGVIIESNGVAFYPANAYRPTYTIGVLVGADKTTVKYINNWLGSASKLIITIQYTKTTDSVLSGPKKGKIVQRSDIYSEEERMIGRWTDGKPIYQKTWFNVPNGTDLVTNVDTLVDYRVKKRGTSGSEDYQDIGDGFRLEDSSVIKVTNNIAAFYCWTSTQGHLNKTAEVITLQYTKTTDAPFSKQLIEDPQFVMMSDIYSEEEQVVGRWTDGKPLYQKIIRGNFNGAYNTTVSIPYDDISYNIEYIVRQESYAKYRYGNITSSDSWFKADHAVNNNINFRVAAVEGSRTFTLELDNPDWATMYDYYLIIQYTKTTDAPGTGPTKGNLIYLPALYSEEEREVGVWTDGKPLYQKVVNVSISSTGWNRQSHGILNVEKFIKVIGGSSTDGSDYYTVGASLPSQVFAGDTSCGIYIENEGIFTTAIIILQYTKTTDQPGSGTFLTDGTPSHHYSTSEKVVGTWIDGSTIYERTWDLGSDMTGSGNTWVDMRSYIPTIPNCNFVLDAKSMTSDGVSFHLDGAYNAGYLELRHSGQNWSGRYITIQYTKSS